MVELGLCGVREFVKESVSVFHLKFDLRGVRFTLLQNCQIGMKLTKDNNTVLPVENIFNIAVNFFTCGVQGSSQNASQFSSGKLLPFTIATIASTSSMRSSKGNIFLPPISTLPAFEPSYNISVSSVKLPFCLILRQHHCFGQVALSLSWLSLTNLTELVQESQFKTGNG